MERFLKSRYKIGEKISENPFSVTYKGAFLGSHKPVIIKIYKRGTLNSGLINRMKTKVKELCGISHHNIARLVDGDYGWQGFYYVREYIEGKTLEELLSDKQALPPERAAAIAEEVSRALEHAHEKGIVHGALKPSNIFISSKGIVKVADFVIEGEIKQAMPQKALSIMDDGRYLSPEELAGSPATPGSDIYALGLILYELSMNRLGLAGKGLEGGLTRMRERGLPDREEIMRLPRYLQDIIVTSTRVDPLLRFASAAEFRESLERKNLAARPGPEEEFVSLFESTVTQYGGEEIDPESEDLKDVGRVNISWGKEKHRNWILGSILAIAFFSGILYAFLFAW